MWLRAARSATSCTSGPSFTGGSSRVADPSRRARSSRASACRLASATASTSTPWPTSSRSRPAGPVSAAGARTCQGTSATSRAGSDGWSASSTSTGRAASSARQVCGGNSSGTRGLAATSTTLVMARLGRRGGRGAGRGGRRGGAGGGLAVDDLAAVAVPAAEARVDGHLGLLDQVLEPALDGLLALAPDGGLQLGAQVVVQPRQPHADDLDDVEAELGLDRLGDRRGAGPEGLALAVALGGQVDSELDALLVADHPLGDVALAQHVLVFLALGGDLGLELLDAGVHGGLVDVDAGLTGAGEHQLELDQPLERLAGHALDVLALPLLLLLLLAELGLHHLGEPLGRDADPVDGGGVLVADAEAGAAGDDEGPGEAQDRQKTAHGRPLVHDSTTPMHKHTGTGREGPTQSGSYRVVGQPPTPEGRSAMTPRRRLVLFLVALALAVVAPGVATARPFPGLIGLPDGFQPEGIASGRGTSLYVGSIPTGAVWRGDARSGRGAVLVPPHEGRAAIGIKVDRRNRIFV